MMSRFFRAKLPAPKRYLAMARLVEGTFPNFEEVIPVNCEKKSTIRRDDLTAGLRRAAVLFANRESPAGSSVRLKFEKGKDLVISATVADDQLTFVVRDTGNGATAADLEATSGTGLKRLRERLAVLYGTEARLDLATGAGGGFSATLSTPYAVTDA